ncbi:MAG: NMD3-related protein [Nanobdellota archaeon]
MRFCPKCGKKTEELYDGLCKECSADNTELFEYTPEEITICQSCGDIHERGRVYKGDTKKEIERIIRKRIKLSKDIDASLELEFELPQHAPKQGNKAGFPVYLFLRGKTKEGSELDEEYEIPSTIRFITCEKCSKQDTDYFEGTLQIRSKEKDKTEKCIEYLREIMKSESKRSVFMTSLKRTKDGADALITSQKHIKDIVRRLHERFGGEIKINEQVFSRDHLRSKDIYRVNALIRLPEYDTGSVIKTGDRLYRVVRLRENNIIGHDLVYDKQVKFHAKDKEIETIEKEPKESPITTIRPNIEALNPESYQSEQIQNPQILKEPGQDKKVKTFVYRGGLWASE